MVMRVFIDTEDHYINLWLPLFIIGPFAFIILFILFLLLLPFMLIASIILWRWDFWRPTFYFWPAIFSLLAGLRGLEVDIDHHEDQVYIAFK